MTLSRSSCTPHECHHVHWWSRGRASKERLAHRTPRHRIHRMPHGRSLVTMGGREFSWGACRLASLVPREDLRRQCRRRGGGGSNRGKAERDCRKSRLAEHDFLLDWLRSGEASSARGNPDGCEHSHPAHPSRDRAQAFERLSGVCTGLQPVHTAFTARLIRRFLCRSLREIPRDA
jgi:hypothetical protein